MLKTPIVAATLVLLATAGCSLGRGAPAPRHFVLGGATTAGGGSTAGAEPGGVRIGLRRLQLATYLNTPFIVVRRGDQEMTFSEFDRWGEPLTEGINRALSGYLAARGDFAAVDVAPWPARTDHDYLIELNVLRFEGIAPADPLATTGEVHVLTEWRILQPGDSSIAARGTTDFRQGGWEIADHASLVGLMNTGLATLSAELIASLTSLAR